MCVGDFAVPLGVEEKELLDGESQEFLILNLAKRAASHQWLEAALGLQSRAFAKTEWPLLVEILQAITDTRKEQIGSSKRASRRPSVVMDAVVRGHPIRVLNSLRAVRFCFKKGEEVEEVKWLLREFGKDLSEIDEDLLTPVKLKRIRSRTSFETPLKRPCNHKDSDDDEDDSEEKAEGAEVRAEDD